ncbi:MAG TPA: histidine phosphatase family protein [Candidatus Dormibacteraeota bacterium]
MAGGGPGCARKGLERRPGEGGDDRPHYRATAPAQPGELAIPTLYLLRHAKSSWEEARLPDHDRPLADRGRHAAQRMAEHLRRQRFAPALVLCSSARRARETLELIAPALGEKTRMRVLESVYMADAEDLLDQLRRVSRTVPSVLVVGHNPGLHDLATSLAAGGGDPLDRLRVKFPTGGLATLRVRGSGWRQLTPGGAELIAFTTPRDLESDEAAPTRDR